MGDVAQRLRLGCRQPLDPQLAPLAAFYDRAEQIYRANYGTNVPVQSRSPRCVKECLAKRVEKK